MEPVTYAIVSALGAELVKSSVKDAYDGLKSVIRRKWGESGPIKAIAALEDDPKSKAQAAIVDEKIVAVKANEDTDVLKALRQLIEQMKAHGVGGEALAKIQINMSGGVIQGVAGAENVQVGSMTFGDSPKV